MNKNIEGYDDISQFTDNSVEIDLIDTNNSVEIDPAEFDVNNSVELENDAVLSDTDKAWYILPIILKNNKLHDKKKIKNIETVDMTDNFLIKVTYNGRPFEYDNEECFHSDYNSDDGYVVVYKAPKDKEYICRMVAKSGHKVLTKDMLMTYFVKL
jgi:hypothetical protein